jgi:hypothetical protein
MQEVISFARTWRRPHPAFWRRSTPLAPFLWSLPQTQALQGGYRRRADPISAAAVPGAGRSLLRSLHACKAATVHGMHSTRLRRQAAGCTAAPAQGRHSYASTSALDTCPAPSIPAHMHLHGPHAANLPRIPTSNPVTGGHRPVQLSPGAARQRRVPPARVAAGVPLPFRRRGERCPVRAGGAGC